MGKQSFSEVIDTTPLETMRSFESVVSSEAQESESPEFTAQDMITLADLPGDQVTDEDIRRVVNLRRKDA